jgi:membrane protein
MISLQAAKQFVDEKLWVLDLSHLPRWKAWFLRTLRLLLALVRDISEGELTLRAMSLVYTTLLSLVPLLAVSFSVLKAFGVHNQIEPMLMQFLAPFGPKGREIAFKIVEFVENMKVGILGAVGLALLLYTVVGLIQKIENAFNFTWHVKQSRSLPQRFSGYLSVIIIGPVLVFSAL